MSLNEYVSMYRKQGYRTLEIPENPEKPKALLRKNWQSLPSEDNIKTKMYGVIQDHNDIVVDIDDVNLNDILKSYLDKTLVVETGSKGRHYYFKDIARVKQVKTTKLYKDNNPIGDIKAKTSYVIGIGSSYTDIEKNNTIKSYKQISSTSQVLQVDFEKVITKLQENGITTTKSNPIYLETRIVDKAKEGERNTQCFKVSCKLFKDNSTLEEAMNLMKAWNATNDNPLDESEVIRTVESAYKTVSKKEPKQTEVDIYKIAEELENEYTFVTLEKSKEILFYSDGIYLEGGEEVISKRSRKLAENIKLHHIREIQGIIRDDTGYIKHDEFDKDSHIINLKQGLFNLKTGTIDDHSTDYLSRVRIPIYYNPKATCPRFDKFLDSSLCFCGVCGIFPDEKKIRTVLEMMAYTLIKDSFLLGKAFMNTGKGSNGKSLLFDILFAMLGKENVSAKTIHDFQTNQFATSALENKLANICADVGNQGLTETETLKKIITGDVLDCEKKFMSSYTFIPYATLIFSANEIPEVSDESEAFARRFELIDWNKSFYGKQRDKTLKTIRKDKNELSGIFNKLIPIAKYLLQEEKLMYESSVQEAKEKWLEKSDSVGQFMDIMIDENSQRFEPISTVKSQYIKFCKENNFRPATPVKFNEKMESQGFERTSRTIQNKATKVWLGFVMNNLLL